MQESKKAKHKNKFIETKSFKRKKKKQKNGIDANLLLVSLTISETEIQRPCQERKFIFFFRFMSVFMYMDTYLCMSMHLNFGVLTFSFRAHTYASVRI